MEQEKKYKGYGYHGGGRKKKPPEEKKVFKSVTIAGTEKEITTLKELARRQDKSVSRFVIETIIKN